MEGVRRLYHHTIEYRTIFCYTNQICSFTYILQREVRSDSMSRLDGEAFKRFSSPGAHDPSQSASLRAPPYGGESHFSPLSVLKNKHTCGFSFRSKRAGLGSGVQNKHRSIFLFLRQGERALVLFTENRCPFLNMEKCTHVLVHGYINMVYTYFGYRQNS